MVFTCPKVVNQLIVCMTPFRVMVFICWNYNNAISSRSKYHNLEEVLVFRSVVN